MIKEMIKTIKNWRKKPKNQQCKKCWKWYDEHYAGNEYCESCRKKFVQYRLGNSKKKKKGLTSA